MTPAYAVSVFFGLLAVFVAGMLAERWIADGRER